ncbi:MAG: hypothetical protein R3B93_02250 [Bacteroidia bacterium]
MVISRLDKPEGKASMEFNLYDPAGRKVWTKHKDQYLKNVVSVNLSDLH